MKNLVDTYYLEIPNDEWMITKNRLRFTIKLHDVENIIENGTIGTYKNLKCVLRCKICGKLNTVVQYNCSDFIWLSEYAHYILEHSVKPPKEFIDFIILTYEKKQRDEILKDLPPVIYKDEHPGKTIIGYFYNEDDRYTHNYPKPIPSIESEWIDELINFGYRLKLVEKLIEENIIKGEILKYKGDSKCRICHKWNGSWEFVCQNYVWPIGYSHYILEHHIKPPNEFINFINNLVFQKGE